MSYLSDLDLDIRARLCDFTTCVHGSLNDMIFEYEQNKLYLQKSALRFEYYDRPSHLFVKAYKKVMRDYGYERRNLP